MLPSPEFVRLGEAGVRAVSEGFSATAGTLDEAGKELLQVVTTLRPADPAAWPAGDGVYGFASLSGAMAEAQTAMTTRVGDLASVTVGSAIRLQDCAQAYRDAEERVRAALEKLASLLVGAVR
ncbi:hypothetical protein CWIS_06865 [Cellulomonas sp. A375-1]|uniref:Uncharacterized protein n=1 Tax=Cellulomonas gelida TaxID=1712 RepID=A0A4Y3KIV7_9CELL|nr:hypothetical protein CWIS_06865 [Cellulomonas sp. A375-1]GEA83576.1 hypothetical protein CGE01nite_08270 [Cellulomonas gelida]GGL22025.1 hypothetical protein GCM10009774_10380 [Cellulomonas gelida]